MDRNVLKGDPAYNIWRIKAIPGGQTALKHSFPRLLFNKRYRTKYSLLCYKAVCCNPNVTTGKSTTKPKWWFVHSALTIRKWILCSNTNFPPHHRLVKSSRPERHHHFFSWTLEKTPCTHVLLCKAYIEALMAIAWDWLIPRWLTLSVCGKQGCLSPSISPAIALAHLILRLLSPHANHQLWSQEAITSVSPGKLWNDGQATEKDVYKPHTSDFSCLECVLYQQK